MLFQVVMMLSAGYFRIRNALPGPVWTYPISYIAFHTYSIQACVLVYSFIEPHIWNYICWLASCLFVRIAIPCNHGPLGSRAKTIFRKSYLLFYLTFRWNLWKLCPSCCIPWSLKFSIYFHVTGTPGEWIPWDFLPCWAGQDHFWLSGSPKCIWHFI